MRVFLVVLVAACGAEMRDARAIQPNPALLPPSPDRLALSAPVSWYVRDSISRPAPRSPVSIGSPSDYSLSIPGYWQLRSVAQFAVLAPDRIRVHLVITRRDIREASLRSWRVWLEDDTGRKLDPAPGEPAKIDRLLLPWSTYYLPGRAVAVRQREMPGWTAYSGRGEFVFTAPGLLSPERKSLSLVAERDGYRMRFTWIFGPGQDVSVEDHGRTRTDVETGVLVAPSGDTQLVESLDDQE
ncbi:MAG TPA: hypothetical protein VKE22_11110 [Haliangiales bacterium]|nr:hypothetical protein [Haliangiales bacterium]